MGEFSKDQGQGKFEEKGTDKSAFQQIGDDKGEGGQQDIKTDSTETSTGKQQEYAGADKQQQAGEDFGDKDEKRQQDQQDFAKSSDKQQGDQNWTDKDQNQQR